MLNLLLYMNIIGSLFFLFRLFLLPIEKKVLAPVCRVSIYRINLLTFIIPLPILIAYGRMAGINLDIPIPLYQYKGWYIAVPWGQDTFLLFPEFGPLWVLLFLLWILFTAFLFLKFFALQYRIAKFLKYIHLHISADQSTDINRLVSYAKKELKMKSKVHIHFVDGIASPYVTGVFHPALYLPSNWDVPEHVYYMAIKHELAHIRNKDLPFQILGLIVRIIHWYNPIVYFLSAKMTDCDELAADACACANASQADRTAYGNTILNLLSDQSSDIRYQKTKGLALNMNQEKIVRERIIVMKTTGTNKHKPIKAAVYILTMLIIFLLSASPALTYGLPAAVPDLSPDNSELSMTSYTFRFSPPPELALMDSLDFLETSEYFVDENGILYAASPTPNASCSHNYSSGTTYTHTRNENGSCTMHAYKAKQCSKCRGVVRLEHITVAEYDKCFH